MRALRATLVLLPLWTACAQQPPVKPEPPAPARDGKVSYNLIPTGAAGQYHLDRQQHAFGAQAVVNDPPTYPPALVARNLSAQTVHAKVIVDGEGKVSDVRDLDTSSDPDHVAFFAATRAAAMGWRYTPMTLVHHAQGSPWASHSRSCLEAQPAGHRTLATKRTRWRSRAPNARPKATHLR